MKIAKLLILLSLTACYAGDYDESEKLNIVHSDRGVTSVTTPQNCPNWTKESGVDYANRQSSNYGCATVNNFGVMIADPNDMISGKSSDTYDGQRTSNSVNAYKASGAGVAQ